jgi:hypothetical protein
VADPEVEWSGGLATPTACRVDPEPQSPRLYPGALVWCLKKPGRDLREKIELWLAWKRVAREVAEGTLGGEFDKSDWAELQSKVKDSEGAAKDEVWGDYRFAVDRPRCGPLIERRDALWPGPSQRSSPRRSSTSP